MSPKNSDELGDIDAFGLDRDFSFKRKKRIIKSTLTYSLISEN